MALSFLGEMKCQANRDTLQNPTRVCVSGQKSDRWPPKGVDMGVKSLLGPVGGQAIRETK